MDDLEKLEGKLREIGFSKTETAYYLKLFNAGECSDPERLRILGDKRKAALDEIHRLESKIISMDTVRSTQHRLITTKKGLAAPSVKRLLQAR